jgi:fimbrial chaperone protein
MKKKFLSLCILMVFVASANLFAFQFSPLTQEFDPSGAGSAKTYTIVNDSDEPIAIQISALTRSQDSENGDEINTPADNYFTIVHPKTIVQPQSSEIVRVLYKGPKTVSSELAFRIRAEQLPYSQGKNTDNNSMFNFLYVYTTSAYVKPSSVVENVLVRRVAPSTTIQQVEDADGNTVDKEVETMAVTLSNLGTVHQSLTDVTLIVSDSTGNTVKLEGSEQLAGLLATNILAKKTITKQIPWPSSLSREAGVKYRSSFTIND